MRKPIQELGPIHLATSEVQSSHLEDRPAALARVACCPIGIVSFFCPLGYIDL
jgi:hypothetical protein